jgi:hypothetical protein
MNGIVIADSGPIFSLALIDKLTLLDSLFDDILISKAVWDEISRDETKPFYTRACEYFKDKVRPITGFNELTFIMESQNRLFYTKRLKLTIC